MSTATQEFGFKDWELDPLPYWEFENRYHPQTPRRSYRRNKQKNHAYRKHAMLAGLHEDSSKNLIAEGRKLFKE
jgi:hypothetical protein